MMHSQANVGPGGETGGGGGEGRGEDFRSISPSAAATLPTSPLRMARSAVAAGSASQWDPIKAVQEFSGLVLQGGGGLHGGNRLVLAEFIGSGAHGQVYKGSWRNLPVAIKVRCGVAFL